MMFPDMFRVRQNFTTPRLANVVESVEREMAKLNLGETVGPGHSVAITAGSRGIANIDVIIRGLVGHFRSLGAEPFIVPAMGSHGGGTAEGQARILAGYGVTEENVGAPVRSSMENVIVDQNPQGIPVHFDRLAWEADHVVVCGRVKPHTGFVGEIESGLHKMMLIGLGKHAGAKIYHRAIQQYSFSEIIRAVADTVLAKCRVAAGLAIVENADDETALVEAVAPHDFYRREVELLRQARDWMPRLPVSEADVLIVDRIGKNISGTGMDTNVIGRKYSDHQATDRDDVRIKRIFVRGLTEATHGNATGLGIAEFTNARTVAAVDHEITKINCITGGHPTAAMIPLVYETDRECLVQALSTIGLVEPDQARVLQIADTLHLRELLVSRAYLADCERRDDVDILSEPRRMEFDAAGNLVDV